MRIDPTGYGSRDERIMAFVADEVFFGVFNGFDVKHPFNVWAYKHDDGTYTIEWSYNGIGGAGLTEPILIDTPMTAFANSTPIVEKVIKALHDSGI